MVTMVTKQKIFDQLYLFETLRDQPITHKYFAFIGQGNYEIAGGGLARPLGILCGSKPLVSERLKGTSGLKKVQLK